VCDDCQMLGRGGRARALVVGAMLAVVVVASLAVAARGRDDHDVFADAANGETTTTTREVTSTVVVPSTTASTTPPSTTATTRAPRAATAVVSGAPSTPACKWRFSEPHENTGPSDGSARNYVNVNVERADFDGHEMEFTVSYTAPLDGDRTVNAERVWGDAPPGMFSAKVGVQKINGGAMTVTAHAKDGGVSDCTSAAHAVTWRDGSASTVPQ
jgi:hypothetical protein